MSGSILYFISFNVLLILLFGYKKNEKRVNGISYFVFSFLLVWCYEAVSAGLLNLTHIPINLISVSICDIIAIVALSIVYIKSGKERQEYYWDYKDFIVIAVVLVVALLIAYSRYSGWFEVFRFKSGDGSIHLMWAEDVVRTEKIEAMYFQKMRDGLNLMFITPFLGVLYYYKAFLAFQTFLFALSGITFWTLIGEELKSLPKKVIGFILTIIYMVGYPLNNMLYGFTYWGTSILLITLILYLFKEHRSNNISFLHLMIAVFFANTALCVCYVYFAPVLFGAQFLYIWSERKSCWKEKAIYTTFPLFLAGILCIVYIYFGMFTGISTLEPEAFESEGVESVITETEKEETGGFDGSILSGLALPGVSYYDLYSNFVLLIPFVLIYLWNMLCKRKVDEYILVFILTVGYIGIQFLLYLMGYISLYYYNKNYNLLWLLCFAIMVRVIASTEKTQNQFLISYGLMCSILFAGTLIHVDEKLRERDSSMCLQERSAAYFNLISTNLDTVTDRYNEIKMSSLEQELCNEAAKLTKAGYSVAWVCDWPRFDDFYAITNQIPTWTWDLAVEYSMVENKEVDYALVRRNKEDVYCVPEYVDNQKRVYENAYGYIIEVR